MSGMKNTINILSEPNLEFCYGQQVGDPRDGLSLFGPFDADSPGHPGSLPYAVVGTVKGIELFSKWSEAMTGAQHNAPNDNLQLWPPYPGFQAAFAIQWRNEPVWTNILDGSDLSEVAQRHDPYERVYLVVDRYLRAFEEFQHLDERIAVLVCIVPDYVYETCRIESRVNEPTGEIVSRKRIRLRRSGQLEFMQTYDREQYEFSRDFRRQVKARSMSFSVPAQIIRESTLRLSDENPFGQRPLTPISDRMWNLGSALYYKGGGKPWKLATARDGVCYVGLAFRRQNEQDKSDRSAVCAAQMFLSDGDGIVFLGNYGPWYSPEDRQYHLTREAARNLLEGALKTYRKMHGKALTEVFLHSRSEISEEEFEGYLSAVPKGVKVVGIRVRPDRSGARLYRPGKDWPVLRGTFWQTTRTGGYLYCSGFKPRLGTYDGWETPEPLQIDIQHGDADLVEVARDILGLTKLNYNACNAGDSQPVTVKFSDAVGEILVSNPTVTAPQPTFKYYI